MQRLIVLATLLAVTACSEGQPAGNAAARVADVPARRTDVVIPNGMARCDVKTALADAGLREVGLYPGSTITQYLCQPANDGAGDVNRGRFIISFKSPAKAIIVRDWLRPRLAKAGMPASNDGAGLRGKDADGAPYRVRLLDDGQGGSTGMIDIAGLPVG